MKDRKNIKTFVGLGHEEEIIKREPLLKFSFYLSDRNNLLLRVSDEILENLDKGFASSSRKDSDAMSSIINASDSTWFWILGAYEVVRTISQAKECFSDKFIDKINELKKELAIVRMPSAKMEKKGRKEPVSSSRCADGWDIENKDLVIGDPENPKSARELIELYDKTLCSLEPDDVIKRHQDSYEINK